MGEVKKILEKQLALIFKYSENLSDTDELCGISEVMVKVAGLLMGEQS